MQALSSVRVFWGLWLALGVIRITLAQQLPLFGDEAWYWLEGQHLSWAYSDLPPLVAWMARLGVETGGHSWLGLRWPFLAMACAVPLLLRASAARRGGPAAGNIAGTLAMLLPLLGGLGFLALPDVPLTFAAALCLYAGLRLCESVDARAMLCLGLGLVIGGLSHYRFALIVTAGGLGLLLDPGGRRALRDPRVWLVIGAGAAAWLPLLLWNLGHGGAGMEFQFAERHPWRLHPEGIWLPLSQLLVVSPLLLVLLLFTLRDVWHSWRQGTAGAGLLLVSALLPLACYGVLAFFADRERVSFHWLLQAWLPLLVAAPPMLLRWSATARGALIGFAGLMLAALLGYAAMAATPTLRNGLADSRWYPDNFAGWEEIAAALDEPARAKVPIVADNFMLGAQLAFARRQPELRVLDHPLNHKHGRALQLRLWDMEASLPVAPEAGLRIVVEDTALPLRLRLARDHRLCEEARLQSAPRLVSVDRGRKRFLVHELVPGGEVAPACVLPSYAWIDAPAPGETVGTSFDVAGWAFRDGAGVAQVEVLLDGVPLASADYGAARPHVQAFWRISTDASHPHVGFTASVDASGMSAGNHWLGLRVHGQDGSVEDLPQQRVRISALHERQGNR